MYGPVNEMGVVTLFAEVGEASRRVGRGTSPTGGVVNGLRGSRTLFAKVGEEFA